MNSLICQQIPNDDAIYTSHRSRGKLKAAQTSSFLFWVLPSSEGTETIKKSGKSTQEITSVVMRKKKKNRERPARKTGRFP